VNYLPDSPPLAPWLLNQLIATYNNSALSIDDDDLPRPWPKEREALMDRIDQLETELGIRADIPPMIGVPRNMGRLLAMLLKREVVTREGALLAIYSGMPNTWDKEPDPKIIDVFICKLRTRLKKYGIKVSCKWGLGYFMDGDNKKKLRELIAQSRAAAGQA
jgi:two-component system cell cycle response regulator CtrA